MVVLLETTGTPETLAITVQAATGALLEMMVTPATQVTMVVQELRVMGVVLVTPALPVTLGIRVITETAALGAQEEPVAAAR